ncbi:hypothetical protein [Bacillus sp. V2I10]|nr:hypothetical protein [Bacillus sp. V2I10]MDQ0860469.1 EAL domain-containing protein (putative c-di-GMP-specific phosphodiesterase class I) [Bacillus sp. V2I10]
MKPAGFATLEILREFYPDYVKTDRNDISDCDENREKLACFTGTIRTL